MSRRTRQVFVHFNSLPNYTSDRTYVNARLELSRPEKPLIRPMPPDQASTPLAIPPEAGDSDCPSWMSGTTPRLHGHRVCFAAHSLLPRQA